MTTNTGKVLGASCAPRGWAGIARPRLLPDLTPRLPLTSRAPLPIVRAAMKVRNSLKSAKIRDKDCRIVRRRGRVYVINKKNPRMKSRQG